MIVADSHAMELHNIYKNTHQEMIKPIYTPVFTQWRNLMKKVLVLGLCCGMTVAAFATTSTEAISSQQTSTLSINAHTSTVAPVKEAIAETTVRLDAVSAPQTNGLTAISPRATDTKAEELYNAMKVSGEEIPAWLTEAVFGRQSASNSRTGGDDMGTATPIAFAPGTTYTDAGTTTAMTDTYLSGAAGPLACNYSYFTGTSFGSADVFYSFTLTDFYEVEVSTCDAATYDSCLGILNAAGELVAASDDGSGCTGYSSWIEACCLEAGDYYIVVDGYGTSSVGDYTLTVNFGAEPCLVVDPCDDWTETPITLPYHGLGDNTGAVDIYGSAAGDVGYTFTLTEPTAIEVQTCYAGTTIDTDSHYFLNGGPCDGGTYLGYNDGESGCEFAGWATHVIFGCDAMLDAGTYTVIITGYSTYEGPFEVDIAAISCECPPIDCVGTPEVEPNDDVASANIANLGETYCGTTFDYMDGDTALTRDMDVFEVTLAESMILTVDMGVDGYDGVVFLTDAAFTILDQADNGLYCEDETFTTVCMEAGVYYVIPTNNFGMDVDVEMPYSLLVNGVACEMPDPCADAIALACGSVEVAGSNVGNTSFFGNASGDAIYFFDVAVASAIDITLCSALTDYDTYLRIFDGCELDAVEVAYDDDGPLCETDIAPWEPSEILGFYALPGTYYVVVEGYGADEGNFGITLTCTEVTCEPIVCEGTPEVEPNNGPVDFGGDDSFGAIACGETVCGTTSTVGDTTRDTDWFELLLLEDNILTVDLDVEEFNGLLFVLDAAYNTVASADLAGFCEDEQLVTNCLAPGTYYVWVGHNDFSGVDVPANYGVTVSCELCTPPAYMPCQPVAGVDASWTFGTAEVDMGDATGIIRYEQFGGAGSIEAVDFVGLNLWHDGAAWNVCSEEPMPFVIDFYENASGMPGALAASFNMDLTGVLTGDLYAGVYESTMFSAVLPSPVALTDGFVSITGAGSVECWFLWGSSDVGTDAASFLDQGAGLEAEAFDLNYCFTLGTATCDAPANMVIAMNAGSAELSWDAVAGATDYKVLAATDGYGTFVELGTTAGALTFTDVNAVLAGRQFYQIVAICE
jgi:hypothetical protein